MRKNFSKLTAVILSFVMVLACFTACGNSAEPAMDEVVDAAVKAALEASVTPTNVTLDADGRQVTVEDAQNMSIQQLLDQAGITLNEGDVVSVSSAQTLSGNITVQVLRRNIVSVNVDGTQYAAVLMGGTVAEALEILGVELAEDQLVNFDLTQALENGMEIVVTTEEPVEETEATEPEEESSSSSSSSSGSSSSGSSSSGSSSSGSSSSGSSSSGSSSSGSSSSGSSSSGSSSSGSSSSGSSSSGSSSDSGSSDSGSSDSGSSNERTVVSVVYYDDCDGSGHGVKVITYSDGTQEEVPY